MPAQAGADKDKATFDEGFTPLHLACHRGSLEVIHLLLAAGANKDKTLSNGHFGLAAEKKWESGGITRSLSIGLVAQSFDFEPPDPFRLLCFMLASNS